MADFPTLSKLKGVNSTIAQQRLMFIDFYYPYCCTMIQISKKRHNEEMIIALQEVLKKSLKENMHAIIDKSMKCSICRFFIHFLIQTV